jgi:hypothetical protein
MDFVKSLVAGLLAKPKTLTLAAGLLIAGVGKLGFDMDDETAITVAGLVAAIVVGIFAKDKVAAVKEAAKQAKAGTPDKK